MIKKRLDLCTQLNVKFNHIDDYWLSLEILFLNNDKVIEQVCCEISAIFCPFKNLIEWLEFVIDCSEKSTFTWEAEGPEGAMRYINSHFYLEWSGLSNIASKDFEIICHVNKKDLVNAFYGAFRSFVSSQYYKPELYEALSLGDELRIRHFSGLSKNELMNTLLTLNSKKLNEKLVSIRQPIKIKTEQNEGIKVFDVINIGSYFDEDWDGLEKKDKSKSLQKILRQKKSIGSKTNLIKLRSTKIEGWLKSQSEIKDK